MDEEGMFTLNQFRVLWTNMVKYGTVSPTFLAEIALRRERIVLSCDLLFRKAQSHLGIPDEAGQAHDKPEGSMQRSWLLLGFALASFIPPASTNWTASWVQTPS